MNFVHLDIYYTFSPNHLLQLPIYFSPNPLAFLAHKILRSLALPVHSHHLDSTFASDYGCIWCVLTFKSKGESFAMFWGRWPTTVFFLKQSFLIIATASLWVMFEGSGLQDNNSRIKHPCKCDASLRKTSVFLELVPDVDMKFTFYDLRRAYYRI